MKRLYGTIEYTRKVAGEQQGAHWVIRKLEPHVCIKLKANFHGLAKGESTPFRLADKPEMAFNLEWFMQRYPLEIGREDLAYLLEQKTRYTNKVEELEAFLRPDYVARTLPLKLPLRTYQTQVVDLLLANGILICGDVVGLGKSPTGIGTFTDPRTLPAMVVCQTHLPPQWVEQIDKFIDLKVHIIKTRKPYNLPPADVYIMTYSKIAGWVDTFQTEFVKSVIFDEVQELRRSDSDKYRAAKKLCSFVDFRLGLSATPVTNYGDEIWTIYDCLQEGVLGPHADFIQEWCQGYNSHTVKKPEALGAYLRENFLFLRRTRAEVGMELQQVNTIVHTVEFDEKAVEEVEDIARKLAIRVTTGSFVHRGQAARELDIMVRQATGVSKAKYVAEYVKILLDNGEPVVVAGWHRAVYDIWLKELADYNPVMYTGSENKTQKEKSKQDFISGKTNLMFMSIGSAVGVDGLQERCSTAVVGELAWNPSAHEQFIGRFNRDGQKNQVMAIYLVSDSGSDPLLVDLLGLKSSQAAGITDPFSGVQQQFSDDSRMKLLAERILAKSGGAAKPEELAEAEAHMAQNPVNEITEVPAEFEETFQDNFEDILA